MQDDGVHTLMALPLLNIWQGLASYRQNREINQEITIINHWIFVAVECACKRDVLAPACANDGCNHSDHGLIKVNYIAQWCLKSRLPSRSPKWHSSKLQRTTPHTNIKPHGQISLWKCTHRLWWILQCLMMRGPPCGQGGSTEKGCGCGPCV